LDIFAEIEMPTGAATALSQAVPQSVGKPDPVREKFYDMRGLAGNNPGTWNDAKLFYRQGRYMENFCDDFAATKDFAMYSPCYQRLGYDQLRTYFTWRTKVRQREFAPAPLPCVFLHIYELLSNIGASDPAHGLAQIMDLWRAYGKTFSVLDDYLPAWLRDYHIYYTLPGSFLEFVETFDLWHHYRELFMFEPNQPDALLCWNHLADYDIAKSRFYNDGNQQLMEDCFSRVLDALRQMCAARRLILPDLLSYKSSEFRWLAFRRAPFYHWYRQPDKRVDMPNGETYTYTANKWMQEMRTPYNFRKNLAGYIVKRMESQLRELVGYKSKISANETALFKATYRFESMGLACDDIINEVDAGVLEFYQDLTRVVVNVDHQNISRIRELAQEVQEKLIVEDEPPTPEEMPLIMQSQPPAIGDIWAALKSALNPTEIEALRLVTSGDGDIKSFAISHGIMPEVLVDSINETAFDIIGDGILDDEMAVYDEYKDNIKEVTEE